MDFRQLKSFVAVAEALHFGRAAEALRIAQPAVSQQVRKLEAELGVELFTRDRHGVALTAAGRTLVKEAKTILAHVTHAREEVERTKAGGAGSVRVGYLPGPGRALLARALKRLRARAPGVRVELRELGTPRALPGLLSGDLDLALLPETAPPHPRGLERTEVGRQRLMLAMNEGHALRKHRRVPLAALRAEGWVIYSENVAPGYRRSVAEVCAAAGFAPKIAERVTSVGEMFVALSSGAGVALLSEGYRRLVSDGVVFRALAPEPEPLAVWAWCRRGGRSAAVGTCLDELKRG